MFNTTEILNFWFANIESASPTELADALKERQQFWYGSGKTLDPIIREKFGQLPMLISNNAQDFSGDAYSRLAAILCCDQFPRHIWRGDALAFSFDATALALLDIALSNKDHQTLHPILASMLLMPLQHAEDIIRQQQGLELYRDLAAQHSGIIGGNLSANAQFMQQHYDIVKQFGRFPHRNDALGRESTAAEVAYLNGGGARFGQ